MSNSISPAAGANALLGEFLNRVRLDVDQRHVRPIVHFVVIVGGKRPLGVKILRAKHLGDFRILDDPPDLVLHEIGGRVVRILIAHEIAERLKHEREAISAIPSLLIHALSFVGRHAESRDGAFLEAKDGAGVEIPPEELVRIFPDPAKGFLRQRMLVAERNHILGRPLQHIEMADLGRDRRYHLHARRTRADNRDSLALEVYGSLRPARGGDDFAFESLRSFELGNVGGGKETNRLDDELGLISFAGIRVVSFHPGDFSSHSAFTTLVLKLIERLRSCFVATAFR